MQQLDDELEVKDECFYDGEKRIGFQSLTSFVRSNATEIYRPMGMLRLSAGSGLAPLSIHQVNPKENSPWWSYHIMIRSMARDHRGYFEYRMKYTCLISDNPYTHQSFKDETMYVHPGLLQRRGKDTWDIKTTATQSLSRLYQGISQPTRIVRGLKKHADFNITEDELKNEVLMDKSKYDKLPAVIPNSYIEAHHDSISTVDLIKNLM